MVRKECSLSLEIAMEHNLCMRAKDYLIKELSITTRGPKIIISKGVFDISRDDIKNLIIIPKNYYIV
jgi:hypothetical protein